MVSLIIVLEVIFFGISGIYYMSLMSYTGKSQLHKKKSVLAAMLIAVSMPGIVLYPLGILQKREWGRGLFICSIALLAAAAAWSVFLLAVKFRNRGR